MHTQNTFFFSFKDLPDIDIGPSCITGLNLDVMGLAYKNNSTNIKWY